LNTKTINILLAALFICPFLIASNTFPIWMFYREVVALFAAALLGIILIIKSENIVIPSISFALLGIIGVLLIQILVLHLNLPGINLAVAFEFLVGIILSVGVASYIAGNIQKQQGFIKNVAYFLVIGTAIQALYGYFQFTGLAIKLPSVISSYGSPNNG
jgi:hypothetical protein